MIVRRRFWVGLPDSSETFGGYAMPRPRRSQSQRPIEAYDHLGQERLNNPPVGLVSPDTDGGEGRKTYEYDPHLDPQLQWAGKAEHTSFDVPTVSLHVHERIDPRTIIEAARKRNGAGARIQGSLFDRPEENPPLRSAIEFYRHRHNWSNRLVAGDSLLVMNSLLEKEGMGGKVQMVYVDPPYGIRYGSNFQPFVNRRDVRDGRDDDLTQEPETIKAFRDTWELGIHSYLSYLRDRLLLARELLADSGSCFVQIGDENLHYIRELMDEVFGRNNLVSTISFSKTTGFSGRYLSSVTDYLVWYARDHSQLKYRQLTSEKLAGEEGGTKYREIQNISALKNSNFEPTRRARLDQLTSQGESANSEQKFVYENKEWLPPQGLHWKTTIEGMHKLTLAGRIAIEGRSLAYVRFLDDFPVYPINNVWDDIGGIQSRTDPKRYVVQTANEAVKRCILMTTDPGDLVFDPTCGSGTTAYVAEQWGRRWITCDTSRVAVTLAKQRLMTAVFDYYELAHPEEGVGSGFNYRTVPHVTLGSIANNPDIREGMGQAEIDAAIARHAPQETLYDQPQTDNGKRRVTGPFSVEAVPAPSVLPVGDSDEWIADSDEDGEQSTGGYALSTIPRTGETLRQSEWRDELLKTGIRGKGGQFIRFARLEALPGCRWLHADGESRPNGDGADDAVRADADGAANADRADADGADLILSLSKEGPAREAQRVVVSFGPEHAPLASAQVESAIQEARTLVPRPRAVVFAAFQFDPEASKDIDETNWPGLTLLKAQMNADLLTEDLKRQRASNESFWLVGQPDVYLHHISRGQDTGKWQVEVRGFDYYNTKTGDVESGNEDKIAVWSLDTDYDGRSLYPRQVFFPMAGPNDGWARLARNLKAEIDEDLIEAYRGAVSLPFEAGDHRRIAVKIVDDRGIESLKVVALDGEPPPPPPAATRPMSIEEKIIERGRRVPQEEWDRVPADLIDRLDYYTAGADV